MTWMREEAPRIEEFLATAVRDPLPDTVVWETETTDRYNRAHWVEIVELGTVAGEVSFPEIRGLPHREASGRIRAVHHGNRVEVQTEGIRRYRLLLAATEFDFTRPVEVVTNGKRSFRATVAPDPAVLLRRYAIDQDRQMLFAYELEIDLEEPAG